jgi:mRNA-degrading endonuclease RelE of RelBE toxin-antitoxin system
MKYEIFLAPRAKKQYERFDRHIRVEIESQLWKLEDDPYGRD